MIRMNQGNSGGDDSDKSSTDSTDLFPEIDTNVRESSQLDNPSAEKTSGMFTENRDVENSIRLGIVHGLRDRVAELRVEIQENLDRESIHPLNMPFGEVGIGLFEIHVLSLSFFESASLIVFEWALEVDAKPTDTLLEYYRDVHQEEGESILKDTTTREEEITIVSDYLQENGTAGQYQSILLRAGIIEKDLHDRIYKVRQRRNALVHQPTSLVEINDNDKLLSYILDCIRLVDGVLDTVEEEVPTDPAFYPYFVERD